MDQDVLGFIDKLTSGCAEVETLRREHIADQGELLPHVLMGDVTRLVIAVAARNEFPAWLPQLLQQLEIGLSSGSSVVAELIGVSFVENLCGETDVIAMLLPRMGCTLQKEVRAICGT